MVNYRNSTKKGYTRSFEEAEMILDNIPGFVFYKDTIGSIPNLLQRINVEQELAKSERLLSTTLRSIGDAVISTNSKGNVSFLNPVAESLTGWKQSEAIGNPIEDVFNIINEKTRKRVKNPVSRVFQEGIIVGLANHTILIAYELHANCFITKPVDMDQFIEVVKSIENFWFSIVKLPPNKNFH